ncbi:ABC transporter permease [Polyangium jinanense]|uniref:ABC transporter permease n=1 Tax=Polyangium jinanense TaxID=2829994 RepID=A0A9X3WZY5_9BACT|nr:ABC transporter permease [Polyangium jinanense]MDC3955078.1 ABC transporter permease [Polyangium jinanense]MDC3981152.1 ABC transporter permease [Polyangium jinanense]
MTRQSTHGGSARTSRALPPNPRIDLPTLLVGAAAAFVLAFIYLPMVVVVVYSFNPDAVNVFPMRGFSLRWYRMLLEDEQLVSALRISLLVALGGTSIGLLLGVPGAIALARHEFPGKRLLERIVLLPLTLPGIVTGVAMLSFFPLIGVPVSLLAVLIGHGTFLIAITLTQVYARLRRLDPSLEEASADLGAPPLTTFFRVILPNIKTAIIGSALLSFTLSLDEIPVTFFLIAGDNTLPIQIWAMMRRGISPEVNAISTLVFAGSIGLILLGTALGGRDKE